MIWMVNDKPIEECKDYIDLACEDAISKKEVFSILTRLMSEAGKDGKLILSDAKEMIGDLPSVAPLRQVGEWIEDGEPWHNNFICSVCGRKMRKVLCGDKILNHWSDYCPDCGADMRRGDADDED